MNLLLPSRVVKPLVLTGKQKTAGRNHFHPAHERRTDNSLFGGCQQRLASERELSQLAAAAPDPAAGNFSSMLG
ncbi:MAG: hypothetical protein WDN00_01425 [Limisphaerales bacterium]